MRTRSRIPVAVVSGLMLAGGLAGAGPASAREAVHTVTCSGSTTVRVVLPASLTAPSGESRACGFFSSSFRQVALIQTNPQRSLRHLHKRALGESELSQVHYTAHGVGFAGGTGARLGYVVRPHDGSGPTRNLIVQDHGVRLWWSTPLRSWASHKVELRRALRSVRVTR